MNILVLNVFVHVSVSVEDDTIRLSSDFHKILFVFLVCQCADDNDDDDDNIFFVFVLDKMPKT